jgi:hypothetical protein
MIHFKNNTSINPFYGMSEVHPALGAICRYENWAIDLGEILHNYAAPIIHWRLGTKERGASDAQIATFKNNVENRRVGEDIVTTSLAEGVVIGAGQKMMQVDNLVRQLQNDIISAMRIPEVFARGGESSNKATAQVELEAFDRKVKALQANFSALVEDYLFPKITGVTRGKDKVRMVWNEFSAEGELMRAQRVQALVTAGVPLKVVLKIVGMGTWLDDVEEAMKDMEARGQQPGIPGQTPPPKDDFRKPAAKPKGGTDARK